jgi:serine/threonine-protein kinase
MATVYLAEDLKHKRRVAVKVLKPELAAVLGAERFVQEITTTAALQHPHILPLFDSGEADGFLYYVMPFIDGETLRAKLDRETQLGVDEALKITTDVADALHYAHSQGIVHRDIKPENILLANGRPMVADFGIALAVSAAAGGRMTETGLSLGTPHYMSPEQATAEKEITARSDQYSLASVLYEMLTGNPPHTGASAQQIIMKIITEAPADVTALRKSVPPNVAAAVAQALEKLPADRFASTQAFAEALADVRFGTTGSTRATSSIGARPRRAVMIAGWSVAFAACAVAAWGWLRPAAEPPVRRYAMALPTGQALGTHRGSRIAVSPDGSMLAYVGDGPDGQQLLLRRRDQLTAVAIPGTRDAINPVFSPDGTRLAMSGAIGTGGIQTVGLGGAPPVTIVEGTVGSDGLTWLSDGNIYYDGLTQGGTVGLMRVRADGGEPVQVTTIDTEAGDADHVWPQALPGARGVLFTILSRNTRGPARVAVLDIASGEVRVLVEALTARYVASGHLLYVLPNGNLLAAPFDLATLAVTGEPFAVTTQVTTRAFGAVDLAVSESGTLVYTVGDQVDGDADLVRVSRDGTVVPVDSSWRAGMQELALSPDGTRLALSIETGSDMQVWVKELPTGPLTKLTFDGRFNGVVAWHPDGSQIGFSTSRTGWQEFWVVPADGSAPAEPRIANREHTIREGSWSRNGEWLINRLEGGSGVVQARRTAGDTTTQTLAVSTSGVTNVNLSPDGRWLSYMSDESGVFEVYVRPFPMTSNARWTVSSGGGWEPQWSRSGRELFYISTDNRMVAVEVLPGSSFTMGRSTRLFDVSNYADGVRSWVVTPDDQAFYFIRGGGEGARPTELVVVDGLTRELRAQGAR